MTTLALPIKGHWLREILAGRKGVEYRDAVPHYDRLFRAPLKWTHIRLRAGYATDAPSATFAIERIEKIDGCYHIHLGEMTDAERIPSAWERVPESDRMRMAAHRERVARIGGVVARTRRMHYPTADRRLRERAA